MKPANPNTRVRLGEEEILDAARLLLTIAKNPTATGGKFARAMHDLKLAVAKTLGVPANKVTTEL